jgi:hypothetical protein
VDRGCWPRRWNGIRLSILTLAVSGTFIVPALAAQERVPSPSRSPGFTLGAAARLSSGNDIISTKVCPGKEVALELVGGFRTRRNLTFQVAGTYNGERFVRGASTGYTRLPRIRVR